MRKQIFIRIIPFLLLCMLPFKLHSQTTVLSQSFKLGVESVTNMNDVAGFDNWTFNNCYATKSPQQALQIGSGSGPYTLGYFITPPIGLEGNVLVLVTTKQNGKVTGKFQLSVVGEGTIASTEYTISETTLNLDNNFRPSAILIKGCLPSTRIKLEDTQGKFYVQSIKAFAVSEAVFYESFDYFLGTGGNDGKFGLPNNRLTKDYAFDAYSGVDFSNIFVGSKCVVIVNDGGSYQTPTFSDVSSSMLLSFRIAGAESSDGKTPMSVEISGGGTMSKMSFDVVNSTWTQCYAVVSGMTTSTRFKFTGQKFFLDDIKLTPIPDGLDQSKDNSAYIEANANQERTVTLTRSLTPGVWCPLCLPFDVTPNLMNTVTATTCELRTFSSMNTETGVFKFNSVEGESTIDAGTPFLIKTSALVSNPTFTGVTIKNVAPVSYTDGDYQFVGIYSPVYLKSDGTNLFLGTDGNLYIPGTEEGYNRLGGMRAYFVVPEEAKARVAIFDEPDVTGISSAVEKHRSYTMYDLFGRPVVSKASRGIVISNGRKWFNK